MNVPQEVLEDFRNHLFFSFKYLGLGEPSPLQYAIAHRIQHGQRDFQLQAGRGAGKSTIMAVYASWLLLKEIVVQEPKTYEKEFNECITLVSSKIRSH